MSYGGTRRARKQREEGTRGRCFFTPLRSFSHVYARTCFIAQSCGHIPGESLASSSISERIRVVQECAPTHGACIGPKRLCPPSSRCPYILLDWFPDASLMRSLSFPLRLIISTKLLLYISRTANKNNIER